ncbi:MAG TPA: HAD family hydrolase [Acidimicrobiia bacterium]|nr:HAD family hydrolase [Acidimicrobiia bacterium]
MLPNGLVVGFDLDMTLIDSRPAIHASLVAMSAELGVPVDADLAITRLGPPLETDLLQWFPADEVPAAADCFRRYYFEECLTGTLPLPGAYDSINAVKAVGGKVIAVTAKSERGTALCLGALDMSFDAVIADVHGDGKRDALKEHNATIYVGDTIADIRAGVEAGAQAVGVSTGMHTAQELEAAGATIVFPSLAQFPSWMERR